MAKKKNDLSDLLPNERNPRRIKPERAKKLAEYLDEFGDLGGIVHNTNPECPALVSGHQRMEVFKREKGTLVLVEEYAEAQPDGTTARGHIEIGGKRYQYRRVNWPKEKADRATIIANGTFGEWDEEKLAEWEFEPDELVEMGVWLADEGEDDSEGGVPNNALNSEKVEEDDFEAPEIEEIKTDIVLGDLFEIGPHRLLCGDSTKAEDVERVMGGLVAEIVLTDPPYGMSLDADYSGMTNKQGVSGRKHSDIIGDESGFDARIVLDAHPLAKEVFLFGADYFAETIEDRNKGAFLVWDKRCSEQLDAVFGSSFELIWSKRRRKRSILRYEYASWGTRMADNLDGKKPHPTMKPVKLISAIISLSDAGLSLIIDPFLGSGTTMVAAHQLGRKCYGLELEPKYCQVIVERMLKLDKTLTVRRNGVEETAKWRKFVNNS